MVKAIYKLLERQVRGLHEAAYLLGLFALLSQFLALIRDRLLTNYFGAGEMLDVYYAAFRIPDFIFVSVASLVSLSVLIPFLTDRINISEERGQRFIGSTFVIFALIIFSISAVVYVFAPKLVAILLPGFVGTESFDSVLLLTRVLLIQPILLGFSSMFASVVHVYQKFILYAVSPLLYNAGIIIGIIFFYPNFGLVGLAYGVVFGSLLHLGLQIPFIIRSGYLPRPPFRINFKEIKWILLLSLPRTITLSAHQMTFLFLVGLASFMSVGSISIFSLAYNLQSVPLAIIGASYSIAAFPTLARLFSNGERDVFFDHIILAARHIIFWSLPALVLFVVLRAQVVRVILGSGEFTWTDTRLTAAALALFAISLLAQSLVLLFVRGYYAAGKTLKPLLVNVFSSILVVAFSYLLVLLYEEVTFWRYFIESLLRVEGIPGTKVLMLPLGYSIALIINVVIFWVLFQRDCHTFSKSLSRTFFQSLLGALTMGIVARLFLDIFDDIFDINTFVGIFAQGFLAGILGILAGITVLRLLKNKEIKEVWRSLHKKFWRTPVISSE